MVVLLRPVIKKVVGRSLENYRYTVFRGMQGYSYGSPPNSPESVEPTRNINFILRIYQS